MFYIKFISPELKSHGIDIYSLGSVLISFQRIVNKAYLSQTNIERLKNPRLSLEERRKLSLEIKYRKKESDFFALTPILTDPNNIEFFKKIGEYVISGIISYYVGDILSKLRNISNQDRIFIGNIYINIHDIIAKINPNLGIDEIEIGYSETKQTAKFTEKHKKEIEKLKNEYYLGEFTTIQGRVYRMYPNKNIVTIRDDTDSKINIYLSDIDFDFIRYSIKGNPKIKFYGRPMYRLGVETMKITEFEAVSIEVVESD